LNRQVPAAGRPSPARFATPVLSLMAALGACAGDQEAEWRQWNASDDQLTVAVGIDAVTDPVEVPLRSSTGEVEVGFARVDPGGGPVGTPHDVVVIVDDEYADVVDRASVRTDSGERGEDEYDLERDSAEEGVYKLTIVSDGSEGESREDIFTFRLWDEVVSAEEDQTSTEDEGT